MLLSVVIVSYNVKYYLEQCLLSVQKACAGLEAEVWVVDNASTDGTVDYIPTRFPWVHFMANADNAGFSRANNMAIRKSTGRYVLLLNPDTVLGEHTLHSCVSFLEEHAEAGAVGVSMLKDDGGFAWESRRGLPTPFVSFCKMSGLGALFPRSRRFGRYYMRYLDRDSANPIEVISGAFNMIRRAALDRVGLLDEDFFMYGEDIDLSYRLLKGGYANYYLPVHILHYKGESTHKSSFKYVHVFYRAMLIFYDKHYRHSYAWLTPLIRMAVVLRGMLDLFIRQRERYALLSGQMPEGEQGKRFLMLGTPGAIERACRVAVDHLLKMDFVVADEDSRPEGHFSPGVYVAGYDYVVYDTSAYSYEKILSLMARQDGQGGLHLATFTPHTGKLITLSTVYEQKEREA